MSLGVVSFTGLSSCHWESYHSRVFCRVIGSRIIHGSFVGSLGVVSFMGLLSGHWESYHSRVFRRVIESRIIHWVTFFCFFAHFEHVLVLTDL